MSDTTASLRRKINSAGDLQSVVRTMKALAASSIGQYENSVRALADYYRIVELGLGACFRKSGLAPLITKQRRQRRQTVVDTIGAVVFGSDQGLVGQFNDVVADYAVNTLAALSVTPEVWAVGERVHARLADAGLPLEEIGQMTVHEIKRAKKELQLLDVRSPDEWQGGHIPKARHIFLGELRAHLGQLDKSRPTAVYCDSGHRASIAASMLKQEGFGCVYNVPGSWQAWKRAGYPVEKEIRKKEMKK